VPSAAALRPAAAGDHEGVTAARERYLQHCQAAGRPVSVSGRAAGAAGAADRDDHYPGGEDQGGA
jgi:hypothetical protein